MDMTSIIAEIDAEIEKLQKARALLSNLDGVVKETPAPVKAVTKRRRLSPKARKAIADAQRKRWAAVKSAKKAPAKKAA